MSDLPIIVRPVLPDDYGYILATWTREYHTTHPFNFIPNGIYFPHQTNLINSILSKATTIVACLEDSPDQIVGFLTYENFGSNVIIHYGVVKGIFRRLGVMKDILLKPICENKNVVITHYFDLFKKVKDKYKLTYDPTFLERYHEQT